MIKKIEIVVVFVAVVILALCMTLNVFAYSASVSAGSAVAEAGEEVSIYITITDVVKFDAIELSFDYDKEIFDIVAGGKTYWIQDYSKETEFDIESASGRILLNSAVSKRGDIFCITFRVKENAPNGTYKISFDAVVKNGEEVADTVLSHGEIRVGCKHGVTELIPGKEATCLEDGNLPYYRCLLCEKYFEDEAATIETTPDACFLQKVNHLIELVDEVKSTCITHGYRKHYECRMCGKFYSDAAGEIEMPKANYEMPLSDHLPVEQPDAYFLVSQANCTKGDIFYMSCEICGIHLDETFEIGAPLGHAVSGALSKDETGHWGMCERCSDKVDFAEHEYDNSCDDRCNLCDYKRNVTHTFRDTWLYNEEGHWLLCSVCGEKSHEEAHTKGDTPSADGSEICKFCGYYIKPADGHTEHDFSVFVHDDEYHWKKCTGCNETSEKEKHVGGTATCVLRANCSTCGEFYGETLPHTFIEKVSDEYLKSAASCSVKSTYYVSCSECGAKGSETFTDGELLPHTYDEFDNICKICGQAAYIPGDLDGIEGVTSDDAFYLLMHTFYPEDYPISQRCDYDYDGDVDTDDAIYILMYTFYPEDYPLVNVSTNSVLTPEMYGKKDEE